MSSSLKPVVPVRPRRFDVRSESEDFLKHLEEHGYAVVASVAGPTEVERAQELFWDFLETAATTTGDDDNNGAARVRREDPSTWYQTNGWSGNGGTGIIGGRGVGQAAFMWYLRCLPDVVRAFGTIWGVRDEELLCSFDGANVFRPWRYDADWRTIGGWYHVDQNAYNAGKADRCCVQGFVTLKRVDESTGGLVVVPKSHRRFAGVCERNARRPVDGVGDEKQHLLDFVMIRSENDEVFDDGVAPSLVCAEAGDLVLWDSRTVHCNSPALTTTTTKTQRRTKQNGDGVNDGDNDGDVGNDDGDGQSLLRMVAYVCMTPASWADDNVLYKRLNAYANNMTTNHWPHEFVGGNPPHPLDLPKNSLLNVDDLQRRLIGGRVAISRLTILRSEVKNFFSVF